MTDGAAQKPLNTLTSIDWSLYGITYLFQHVNPSACPNLRPKPRHFMNGDWQINLLSIIFVVGTPLAVARLAGVEI